MSITTLDPKFVDEIPEQLEDGVLYISIPYAVTVHRCASGCGRETVNPLSPAQWSFTYNGTDISLSPSIGNSGFPCESHYWIRHGRVEWAPRLTPEQLAAGRANDQQALDLLHTPATPVTQLRRRGLLRRFLFRGRRRDD